jgi:hypothetical protein
MSNKWADPSYLATGTPRQVQAFRALEKLGLMAALAPFNPVLAGTVPLDVDIETSDLDILCCARDRDAFEGTIRTAFGHHAGFHTRRIVRDGMPSMVARFVYGGFPVEIFAQSRAVVDHRAYRHLVAEARLLQLGGPSARDDIRRMKREGFKTESAFARYFRLEGDPYLALLAVADMDDEALRAMVSRDVSTNRPSSEALQ